MRQVTNMNWTRTFALAGGFATTALTLVLTLAGTQNVRAQHVHEHGRAALNVAVDENRLVIEFDSPAINVLGFEHEPRTADERKIAEDKQAKLKSDQGLFLMPAGARCHLASATIEPPTWRQDKDEEHPEGAAGQHHEDHQDYVAHYTFECAQIAELRWIDVRLLDQLHAGVQLDANVVTSTTQTRQTLTAKNNRLRVD